MSRIGSIDGREVERETVDTLPAAAKLVVDGTGTVEDVVGWTLDGTPEALVARLAAIVDYAHALVTLTTLLL